jgi:hypothetical protein
MSSKILSHSIVVYETLILYKEFRQILIILIIDFEKFYLFFDTIDNRVFKVYLQ